MALNAGIPRLLLITPDFPPSTGGIQRLFGDLVFHLRGWTIQVATRSGAWPMGRDDGVDVISCRLQPRHASLLELNARAILTAAGFRPDVILCGHVITGPGAVIASRTSRVPLVTYVHADEVPHRPGVSGISLSRSGRVIAVSGHARELAVRVGAARQRVVVVPPGVSGSTKPPVAANQRPTLVTVARLADRYKGHELVLEAVGRLRSAMPNLVWHVIGDGPLRGELEQRAASLGVRDNVIFHGLLSDERRDALVCSAHAFVMPSRLQPSGTGGEGFGIVYLEAAAMGVPSVAGNVGGAPDAVIDGVTGLLVDPTDVDAIAVALERLLTDHDLRNRLGQTARARAHRDFGWDVIASRVDGVLRAAIAERGSSARADGRL